MRQIFETAEIKLLQWSVAFEMHAKLFLTHHHALFEPAAVIISRANYAKISSRESQVLSMAFATRGTVLRTLGALPPVPSEVTAFKVTLSQFFLSIPFVELYKLSGLCSLLQALVYHLGILFDVLVNGGIFQTQ